MLNGPHPVGGSFQRIGTHSFDDSPNVPWYSAFDWLTDLVLVLTGKMVNPLSNGPHHEHGSPTS